MHNPFVGSDLGRKEALFSPAFKWWDGLAAERNILLELLGKREKAILLELYSKPIRNLDRISCLSVWLAAVTLGQHSPQLLFPSPIGRCCPVPEAPGLQSPFVILINVAHEMD